MSKLTLNVAPSVVSRAKRYAKRHGVSISGMVEAYLASVSEPKAPMEDPPLLRVLRGTLHKADPEDYRKYLRKKYR